MSLFDELTHVHQLITVQGQIHGIDINVVTAGQAAVIIDKIQKMQSIDAQHATSLITHLSTGPWSTEQKQQLVSAVNTRLTAQQTSTTKDVSSRRSNQSMNNFQAYIPGSLLTILQGQSPDMVKLKAVVELCARLGLECPSEKTTQHIISVFTALQPADARGDVKLTYSYVVEFKRMLKATARTIECGSAILAYPGTPKELPSDMYTTIYKDDEPVDVGLTLTDIQDASTSVALRKSSKLLRSSPSSCIMQPGQLPHGLPQLAQQIAAQIGSALFGLQATPRRATGINLQYLGQHPPLPGFDAGRDHVAVPVVHSPSPTEVGAHPTMAIEDKPTSQVHAVPPPVHTAPAPTLPVSPITPAAAAQALLNAVAARADADGATKSDGETPVKGKKKLGKNTKTDKKVSPMKSDKTAGSGKKDKKASQKTAKPTAAKKKHACKNIPDAILKKYKNGCARCRFTKNCTPSCWTSRGYY